MIQKQIRKMKLCISIFIIYLFSPPTKLFRSNKFNWNLNVCSSIKTVVSRVLQRTRAVLYFEFPSLAARKHICPLILVYIFKK